MPDTQIINPVAPSVRVSSMDGTKMLTHPAAVPPRRGTQKPLRQIAGAISPRVPNVVMKQMPVELKPGRVDQLTGPERQAATRRSAAAAAPIASANASQSAGTDTETIVEAPDVAESTDAASAIALPAGGAALCLYLLDKHAGEITATGGELPGDTIELLEATRVALHAFVSAELAANAHAE